MRILVPTDFSAPAENAAWYAAKMATKLKAELVFLHVAYIEGQPHVSILKTTKLEGGLMEYGRLDCVHLIQRLTKEMKSLKASYQVVLGYPVRDVVENYAIHNSIDFVVIGTKGASGLHKVLIGSNAAALIGKCSVPVIVVPEHARFKNIKHIVYASDLRSLRSEMKELMTFAALFRATVHIVHVASPASKKKVDRIKIGKELARRYPGQPVSVHIVLNDDTVEAIDHYIGNSNADMLAMFTHKPTFFEKLFGKSVTREMAFHMWVPLLSMKKTAAGKN